MSLRDRLISQLRHWHLLPFLPFFYGWFAVFYVKTTGPLFAQQGGDDAIEILIGAALLALISLAIWLARRWRQAAQTGWRWAGYVLTTLAIPSWFLALLICIVFAALDGHSFRMGC